MQLLNELIRYLKKIFNFLEKHHKFFASFGVIIAGISLILNVSVINTQLELQKPNITVLIDQSSMTWRGTYYAPDAANSSQITVPAVVQVFNDGTKPIRIFNICYNQTCGLENSGCIIPKEPVDFIINPATVGRFDQDLILHAPENRKVSEFLPCTVNFTIKTNQKSFENILADYHVDLYENINKH